MKVKKDCPAVPLQTKDAPRDKKNPRAQHTNCMTTSAPGNFFRYLISVLNLRGPLSTSPWYGILTNTDEPPRANHQPSSSSSFSGGLSARAVTEAPRSGSCVYARARLQADSATLSESANNEIYFERMRHFRLSAASPLVKADIIATAPLCFIGLEWFVSWSSALSHVSFGRAPRIACNTLRRKPSAPRRQSWFFFFFYFLPTVWRNIFFISTVRYTPH